MMEKESLFWGLVVEQGKQYKQTPKFNFHVSMAALDLKNTDGKPVSVYVQVENGEFILCNLNEHTTQVNLDMIFSEGEKIKFYTAGGKSNVHLTGYVMPEDDLGQYDEEDLDDESVDSMVLEQLVNKRKNTETLKLAGKDAKKLKNNDGKAVEIANPKQQQSQPKIVDVDPKQLLKSDNKKTDKQQPDGKKNQSQTQQPANQKVKQPVPSSKTKEASDDDDDLSVDEDEESVDLNKMAELMDSDDDELDDEDLESDDDLDSDDDIEDVAKMNAIKNKMNKQTPQAKPQQQQNANAQKSKPNDQKQQQGKPNNFQNKQQQQNGKPFNKSPQQFQNKSHPNTPHNKGHQKHQNTPFAKNQNQNSNQKKSGTPFQHQNKNKSFGSHNKPKKVF